jgi:lysozyme
MNTSARGYDLIRKFEVLVPTSYKCAGGVWTVGYGHTRGVTEGMTIDGALAEVLLCEDVERAEAALRQGIGGKQLTQNQWDALVSFIFNVGSGAFLKSTLLRKLKAGDPTASAEFDKWVFAKGKKLAGLIARRKAERELFEETT